MLKTLTTAVTVVVLAFGGTTSASAATPPLRAAHIADHFDLAAGQTPENIDLDPGGGVDVTFAVSRQVARIDPRGGVHVLATLPAPPAGAVTPVLGFPLTLGIVTASDGTIYFLYASGSAAQTGLWRLRPGGSPTRIAALPATSLPNGLGFADGQFYIADSALGVVWRVGRQGGTPRVWASGAALRPSAFLGANGLKVHAGAVWVANLDAGTLLRIPIGRRGAAGAIAVRASGLAGIDDFTFTGHGEEVLAALDPTNEVALVRSDGSHRIVLTGVDGLQNPTSVAVRCGQVFVTSAAYQTGVDPNLLVARLGR